MSHQTLLLHAIECDQSSTEICTHCFNYFFSGSTLPQTNVGAAYYSPKLNFYNLTLCEFGTKQEILLLLGQGSSISILDVIREEVENNLCNLPRNKVAG